VKPDKNFRPSVDRAIYICSEFSEEECAKLIPKIYELRSVPDVPITVYINSRGGNVGVLDTIIGLLKHKDINGITPRLITVVSGEAASAAAMLLAMGDYAIAYEHSVIHFHGIRLSEISDLTTEKASNFAEALAIRNRSIALKVANEAVKRLAHRYCQVSPCFNQIRTMDGWQKASDLKCFVEAISPNLTITASDAANEALRKAIQAQKLSAATLDKPLKRPKSQLQVDLRVLRSLISHEANEGLLNQSALDEDAIGQITSDYLLLRDYHFGGHVPVTKWISDRYGMLFLTNEEVEKDSKIADEKARTEWRRKLLYRRIRPFWYFTVLLCRRLHEGENRLTSQDAYWLGLVDEVIGTELNGYRTIIEQQVASVSPILKENP
jgi:ATP-dependent protease ClpP protease subunit